MEGNKSQLDVLIKNLCIVIHTELENIGGDFTPSETISDLLATDSFKSLDYISATIEKALQAKAQSKEDSLYEEFLNDESYQKEMQKLESEIRNHIKTEQQMKLYADALEEKSEKLANRVSELKKQGDGKLDSAKQANKIIKSKISMLQKEITEDKKEGEGLSRTVSRTRLGLAQKSGEIDKKIARAEFEHTKVLKTLQEAEKEYSQQKKDNDELKTILKDFMSTGAETQKEKALVYKKKYEQKCIELESLKKKLKMMEVAQNKGFGRSVTPTLTKTIQVQSQKLIKKTSSTEKLRQAKPEKLIYRPEPAEKKRLPLSFTSRK